MLSKTFGVGRGSDGDERLSKRARSFPEPELLELPEIDPKYDRTYRARAREDDSDATFEVNVAGVTCSCPDYVENRTRWPERDVRRVCEHLYDKFYSTKVERGFDPLFRLLIRYGRAIERFYEYKEEGVLCLAGFPVNAPRGVELRIFARFQEDAVTGTYDVENRIWEHPELHSRQAHRDEMDRLARIFVG